MIHKVKFFLSFPKPGAVNFANEEGSLFELVQMSQTAGWSFEVLKSEAVFSVTCSHVTQPANCATCSFVSLQSETAARSKNSAAH